ncbi:MAG: hypothetical protein WCS52_08615 [bacterium]|jgi:hypothetical protein
MRLFSKLARLSVVVCALALLAGCGERPKIAYYLIYPAAGEPKVTDADETRLKEVLDRVATTYQMSKTKPSDLDIIRYYQPTPSLTIAFYAKRTSGRIAVHLMPLTRGLDSREYYQQFHRALVDALSQNFPGRVASMKEP